MGHVRSFYAHEGVLFPTGYKPLARAVAEEPEIVEGAEGAETVDQDPEGIDTPEDAESPADGDEGTESVEDDEDTELDIPTESWTHAKINEWVDESGLAVEFPRDPSKAEKIAAIHAALAGNLVIEE